MLVAWGLKLVAYILKISKLGAWHKKTPAPDPAGIHR